MREDKFLFFVGLAFFILFLSGCVSVSDSPSPRKYMPHAISKDKLTQKLELKSNTIIGVGPIRVPEYLDRPQIVTQDKNNLTHFAQFDRWAEPIDTALTRVIDENLSAMLVNADVMKFSWSIFIPVKYQVAADIIQLENNLEGNLRMVVQWNVFDLDKKELVFTKRSEITQPIQPPDYFGLSEALSQACIKLSYEMAAEVAVLVNGGGV